MRALAFHATTSPHDACWEFIPLRDLDRLSAAVFRAYTRAANHRPNCAAAPAHPARQAANVFSIGQSRAASG